ncbi:PUA-like domain-containing protein [Tricharina praecox]|uniref:PUA-like domain-containing protein n=1 Tax=Tricharina praecox TaxID=43433 RepID=UPI00221F5CBA|nr:PUA-like domain-containing protein [Tricharina praecox]KAI5848115.1 PUA-like domain-containing protein [Tricharina praecox]
MFRLLFWRRNFQNCDKKLREQGADSLTMEDLTMLKQGLDRLAYIKFEEDALEWVDKTGILSALRLLTNRANFDDDTVEMATTLRQRWMEKNFNPGPISSKEEESASESESEAENIQPVSFGAFSQSLMHGILRYRNARGHMTMKLDPRGLKRRADVFGHNGLTVGDWWPYQLCALRDGAHGSKQGGIAGRAHSGAFSIVVSAESEYGNEDSGDRLSYLGTQHIGPEGTTMLTNATKSLIMSIRTGNPVRVIRRGPSPTSRIYPSCGFRYDGLYTVTARTPVRARRDSPGEHDFYKFTLVRNAGQPPLSNARNRPTPAEYTAYHRLTNSA